MGTILELEKEMATQQDYSILQFIIITNTLPVREEL